MAYSASIDNNLGTALNAFTNNKSYNELSDSEKTELMLPYVQTSLGINEMVNLEVWVSNNKVKLKERSGMRKDRFSALQYNNAIIQELNTKLKPQSAEEDIINLFTIRKAKNI